MRFLICSYSLIVLVYICPIIEQSVADDIQTDTITEGFLEYTGSTLWSGRYDFSVSDGYVYFAMADGLEIINIGDPTHPILESRLYLDEYAECIEVHGSRLYLGLAYTLQVYDISTPNTPVLLGEYNTSEALLDIDVVGEICYLVCTNVLLIVDVSSIEQPKLLEEVELPTLVSHWPRDIKVIDNYAFLAVRELIIVDVLSPEHPEIIATFDTPHLASNLYLQDTLVYIASLDGCVPAIHSAFVVVNISNKEIPRLVCSHHIDGDILGVTIQNDYAFVATGHSGMIVFDISDPINPVPVNSFPPAGRTTKVKLVNDTLYLLNTLPDLGFGWGDWCKRDIDSLQLSNFTSAQKTHWPGGFVILDITNESNPVEIGRYNCLPHPKYGKALITGDYAFVTGEPCGISIADISNPKEPVEVSFLNTGCQINAIDVNERLMLVADLLYGLLTIDFSNPTTPRIISYDSSLSGIEFIKIRDDIAFLSGGKGLIILDIAHENKPSIISELLVPGHTLDILISEQYAYITGKYFGMHIVDIRNIDNPYIVASVPKDGKKNWVQGLSIADNIVTMETFYYLSFIDISDPTIPREVSRIHSQDIILDHERFGNYMVILLDNRDGYNTRIELYNVTDPLNPVLLSKQIYKGTGYNLASRGEYLYLSNWSCLACYKLLIDQ